MFRPALIIALFSVWLTTQSPSAAATMQKVGTHPTSPLTAYPKIHSLKAFQGRMYVGYGDWNDYPACIIASYDPATNVWRCEFAPGTDSLGVFREIDGKLFTAHCDPIHYEDFKDFSYYQPGYGWRDSTPLGLYHAFDFCKLGNDLFFCGAKDSHEGAPSGGLLMISTDNGRNWTAVNPTSNNYSRYYWCFTMNNQVYTQGGYWNGTTWTNGSPLSGYTTLYKPMVIPSTTSPFMIALSARTPGISASSAVSLVHFNGTSVTTLRSDVYDFTWEGTHAYALTTSGIMKGTVTSATLSWSTVPISGIPSTGTCLEVMDGRAWVGDSSGGLWSQMLDGTSQPTPPTPTLSMQVPDGFGRSIAFDGAEVLVSAHEAARVRSTDSVVMPTAGQVNSWVSQGAITNRNWSVGGNFTPPNPQISGWFGKDISIKDGLLGIVEAGYDQALSKDRGSAARVHLFVRGSGGWASSSILNIPFAQSITVDTNLLVIGSSNPAANQAAGKPSLYPYTITRTGAAQTPTFTSKPGIAPVFDSWGYKPVARCAMNSNLIMGGFSGDVSRDGGIGMVSVWNKASVLASTTTAPSPIQEIYTGASDRFGMSIAISETHAVVGAPRDDTVAKQAGAIYLFEVTSSATPLVFRQKISSPAIQAEAGFGTSVALHGDALLVGAPGENVHGNLGRGKVYIYRHINTVWTLVGELLPPSANKGGFGIEVSMNADWMSAGSRFSQPNASFTDRITLMPTLAAHADGYTAWANAESVPLANQPESNDPDADGLINLLEYTCGLNPMSNARPQLTENGAELAGLPIFFNKPGVGPTMRYLTRPNDLRVRQEIEFSYDLETWTVYHPASSTTIAADANLTLKETTLPTPPPTESGFFARVRYLRQIP